MNRIIKFAGAILLGTAVLAAVAQTQPRRSQAEKTLVSGDASFEACVNQIAYTLEENGNVSFRVTLAYEGTPFILTPQGFRHSGSASQRMSLAQVAQWTPVIDQVRDAARQKVKVQFQVDKGSDRVEAIRVKYHLPC